MLSINASLSNERLYFYMELCLDLFVHNAVIKSLLDLQLPSPFYLVLSTVQVLRAGSRWWFAVPICSLSELSLPVICILSRKAQVFCNILKALGLSSLGLLFKSHRVSWSLLVLPCKDSEPTFRIPLYLSIKPAHLDCTADETTIQYCLSPTSAKLHP